MGKDIKKKRGKKWELSYRKLKEKKRRGTRKKGEDKWGKMEQKHKNTAKKGK